VPRGVGGGSRRVGCQGHQVRSSRRPVCGQAWVTVGLRYRCDG
jgi:hypothetical protein